MVKGKIIPALTLMLEKDDVALQLTLLEALQVILSTSKAKAAIEFDAVGGPRILATLQTHKNAELANAAIKVLDQFFPPESDIVNA